MNEMINDHVVFDIWSKVEKGSTQQLAGWISEEFSVSKIDAYRALSSAVEASHYVKIFSGIGWNDVPRYLDAQPIFVAAGTSVVTESDCDPNLKAYFCEEHSLFHCLSQCPVCSNEFVHETGERGAKAVRRSK